MQYEAIRDLLLNLWGFAQGQRGGVKSKAHMWLVTAA